MGFFAPTRKVTPSEWERVYRRLHSRGVPSRILEEVESMINKALTKTSGGGQPGIDKEELRRFTRDLENHPERHRLSPEQVEDVVEALEKEL